MFEEWGASEKERKSYIRVKWECVFLNLAVRGIRTKLINRLLTQKKWLAGKQLAKDVDIELDIIVHYL